MKTWKAVVGWEGIYDVSTDGEIRRIKPAKLAHLTRVGHIMRGTPGGGYLHVTLSDSSRPDQTSNVHVIVMAAHVGPRPKCHDINHKNGDKSDNRLCNLEYCTRSHNQWHMYNVLRALDQRGEKNHNGHKLTEQTVREVLTSPERTTAMARRLGVSHTLVSNIRSRKVWKHVSV